ncbi:MAG: sugar transferase [Acutalibacteraceae bacterium]
MPKNMQNEAVRPYFEALNKRRGTLVLKRFFDLLIAFAVLIILSPIIVISAVLVKCTSRGPVFYLQERIGALGKPFKIIKFRTMVVDADKGSQVTVGDDDPRITKFGSFLRLTRIDEFPQLINVLKGDMGMVGTRPEVKHYVDYYTDEMTATLLIRPGMVSSASIAFRWENDMLAGAEDSERKYIDEILPAKMKYNLEYTKNVTIGKDVIVLLRTVGCIFHK